jgi:hypothetical protein
LCGGVVDLAVKHLRGCCAGAWGLALVA